jgi:hypothetical protein
MQGCQMVEFRGKIPIFSYLIINQHCYLIINQHCYFANLATLSNRQLCKFKKSEIKRNLKYNLCSFIDHITGKDSSLWTYIFA